MQHTVINEMEASLNMVVDVAFRLRGKELPVDHGYLLYSAISDLIPKIHGDRSVGIHPVSGSYVGERLLLLTEKSFLKIRIDTNRISEVLALGGKALCIGTHRLIVGVPMTQTLTPSTRVYSRLVVIKGFTEPDRFLEAASRQLSQLDVKGMPSLLELSSSNRAAHDMGKGTQSKYLRRTTRIHGKEIVGFALRVDGLEPHGSLLLQEKGVGGRRRFGCGLFLPTAGSE